MPEAATTARFGAEAPPPPASADRRVLSRELALSLRSGLRDAAADFSFLRLRGLRGLLKCLRVAAAASNDGMLLFGQSQSVPGLQVIPVLFENSLQKIKDETTVSLGNLMGVDPLKLRTPATDTEVVLALRVLEGCCLLCKDCAAFAHRYNAVKMLLNILCSRGTLEQRACLDTLVAILVQCSDNVMDFNDCDGLKKVVELAKDIWRDETMRIKCVEFLLILYHSSTENQQIEWVCDIQQDFKQLLGENGFSLVSSANFLSSTCGLEESQAELLTQAEHVLESLEAR